MELYDLLKKIKSERKGVEDSPPPDKNEAVGKEIPLSVVALPVFPEGQVPVSGTPLIRVYSWAIRNLRFGPCDDRMGRVLGIESGEMDGRRVREIGAKLKISVREVQSALDQLVRDGDLMVKTGRGWRIYSLSPPRY